MATMAQSQTSVNRQRLWAEFALLFLGVPLSIALFLPPDRLFVALFVFTLVGLALLWRTGGFRWRGLLVGWSRIRWVQVLTFGLMVGVIGWTIMKTTNPDFIISTSPERLRFLVMLWLVYPLLSALPQELIFRALYFHRYGALFPQPHIAILINAAVFSFAHLMYWSGVVAILTFAGGVIFAHLYLRWGFTGAWLVHGVAGNMLFTVGMGTYFWSGNIVRPF